MPIFSLPPACRPASPMPGTQRSCAPHDFVALDVGGASFTTSRSTLMRKPDTFLANLVDLNSPFAAPAAWPDGRLIIDRDGTTFAHVLDYLRGLALPKDLPAPIARALRIEADFYGLDDLAREAKDLGTLGPLYQAAKRAKGTQGHGRAQAELSCTMYTLGDVDGAAHYRDKALMHVAPGDAAFYAARAHEKTAAVDKALWLLLAALSGEKDDKERVLQQAQDLHADVPEVSFALAAVKVADDQLQDGLHLVNMALDLRPALGEALVLRAHILTDLGQHAAALASVDAALVCDAQDVEAHAARAEILYALYAYDEAIVSIEMALRRNAACATYHVIHALSLGQLDRQNDALAAACEAIRLDPKVSHGHYAKAATLMRLGRHDDALSAIDAFVPATRTSMATFYALRSIVQIKRARFAEALIAAEAGIAADPTELSAYWSKSWALNKLARHTEALEIADAGLSQHHEDADGHYSRSLALLHLGRYDDALLAGLEAERRAPTDPDNLCMVAWALVKLGRAHEALAVTARAATLTPRASFVAFVQGLAEWTLKHYDRALSLADQAIAQDDADAEPHTLRGAALLKLGRLTDAELSFDVALTIEPTCHEAFTGFIEAQRTRRAAS